MNFELNKELCLSEWINEKEKTKEPTLSQVYVLNDDFTPKEFVAKVLEQFFYMDRRKALETTMEAHVNGRALCGIFSKDLAETKVQQVIEYARSNDHPLILRMEA